ncbi:MAG: GNAT family N-acetyltransferase, partial [Clostridia bacterium]|nr:GNAT family N-acetyltransferase [Clostridia bacterium]
FTFTNLFMWRKSYDIRYVILHDMLCIMPQHTGGPRSATFPIGFAREDGTQGDIVPVIEELLAYFKEIGETPLIRLYDDLTVKKLTESFPGKFLITEDINSFDYVYKVEELSNLAGKRFHTKKNHVNKFKRLYHWEYQTIGKENLEECLRVFEEWYQSRVDEISGVEEERQAVQELFHNWDALDVRGGCLRVDGKMIAFSVGEPLCGKMAVIHLEHADTAYDGAFAMMNQQFLLHQWQDFEFINREEDMGLPGMRKAKESYRPAFMVKKYVATLLPEA